MTTRIAAGVLLFAVLATANAGGYRYGVSDQAFYAAAVLKDRTPSLFPRDSSLLDTQSRLTASDDLLAWTSRATRLDLPPLFFGVYLLTIVALFAAALLFARALGGSAWATAVFLALLTLRHHIAGTGANTLEGYTHPRMLAFALGLLAVTWALRGRAIAAVTAMVGAALMHPTTALWFGVAIVPVLVATKPAWRKPIAIVVALGALAGVWALVDGPLRGGLTIMDPTWLQVLSDRDYLFPARWPLATWGLNLLSPLVLGSVYALRRRRGLVGTGERALLVGWLLLLIVFAIAVALTAAHLAIAIQIQVDRVFWLLDVAATFSLAWWLADVVAASTRGRLLLFVAVVVASAGRGAYVLHVETHRPLVAIDLPATPWTDAMRWLRTQPISWNVLADPDHAWKYGASVRVAAERDTVLEASKDPAVAIYGRDLAMRVADREAALAGFGGLTTDGARALARRYDADVLVVERGRSFDLPVLYSNSGFTVYDLR